MISVELLPSHLTLIHILTFKFFYFFGESTRINNMHETIPDLDERPSGDPPRFSGGVFLLFF